MSFFTTLLTTIAGGFASTAVGSFLIGTIAKIATNAIIAIILGQGKEEPRKIGSKGKLDAGGDLAPRFPLGLCRVDGQLIYHNTFGEALNQPNGYLTMVIKLSDLPGTQIFDVYVNGALVNIDWNVTEDYPDPAINMGSPITEFVSEEHGQNMWIKYYDGTQTTADPFLTGVASTGDRPWGADRIGTGIAYAVITTRRDPEILSGPPTFKFVMTGIPLYDPSRDSTVPGGSGTHRWDDWTTWGGDGDDLPAVQAYNLLRGIYYKNTTEWMCGLQNLPVGRIRNNFLPAIAACRTQVEGLNGLEPSYRSGVEVDVSVECRDILRELEKACAGRISENGGIYDMSVGPPGEPVGSFTDGDIVGDVEEQEIPFKGLSETTNAVIATFPDPTQGWNMKEVPPEYDVDLEASDGNRRLTQEVQLTAVPFAAQAERLIASALREARRFRTHTLTLPGEYSIFEPNDVLSSTSFSKGYDEKAFRIDAASDLENGDVQFNLTEVDPDDYIPPVYRSVAGDLAPVRSSPTGFLSALLVGNIQVSSFTRMKEDGAIETLAIVTWDHLATGPIAGYDVEWRVSSETAYQAETVSETEAQLSGLVPQQQYTVRVRARSRENKKGQWVIATFTAGGDDTVPKAPQNLVATGGFQSVALAWGPVTENTDNSAFNDFRQYNIYRAESDNVLDAVLVGAAAGASYLDGALVDNQAYTYWVTAVDRSGNESAKSTSATTLTDFISAAQMVEDIRAEIGAARIDVVSELPSGAGYAAGDFVYLTPNRKMYEWNGTQWTTVVGDILANQITAGMISAGAVSADKMAVSSLAAITANLGQVTAGSINTLSGGVGMMINHPSFPKAAYIWQNSSLYYGLRAENTSTAGGSLFIKSNGGFAAQVEQTSAGSGWCALTAQNITGGYGQLGLSSSNGSYGFNAVRGGYYDSSGSGYNPFTGRHEGLIAKGHSAAPGDIVVDGLMVAKKLSDAIAEVHLSDISNQKGAIGVFAEANAFEYRPAAFIDTLTDAEAASWYASHDLARFNSVGEGSINVCGENGDIEKGDLIVCSSTPGKGMRQAGSLLGVSDDVVRSYTVARAREAVTFSSSTEVAQIACIYLCG